MKLKHSGNYSARRAEQYPALADQLDALWHAMDRGELPKVEGFYGPIQRVKKQYPKPQ
jgi:hypothetical protein